MFLRAAECARGLAFDVVFVPDSRNASSPGRSRRIRSSSTPSGEPGAPLLRMQTDRVAAERLALRLAVGAASGAWCFPTRAWTSSARARGWRRSTASGLRAAEGSLPVRRAGGAGPPRPRRPRLAAPETRGMPLDRQVRSRGAVALIRPGVEPPQRRALPAGCERPPRALAPRAGGRWLVRWTPADDSSKPPSSGGKRSHGMRSARAPSRRPRCSTRGLPVPLLPPSDPAARAAGGADRDPTIDPLTRGAMFHEAQFAVLTPSKRARPAGDSANLEAALAAADLRSIRWPTSTRSGSPGDPTRLGGRRAGDPCRSPGVAAARRA